MSQFMAQSSRPGICNSFQMGNVPPKGLTQNDLEWPILPWFCNLSNYLPTKGIQNDSEQSVLPNSQLFQFFPTEAAQNDLRTANFMPNFIPFSILFLIKVDSEWLGMANFTRCATFQIFSHQSFSEWLGMSNFAWFAIFVNLFPPKQLKMTGNGKFLLNSQLFHIFFHQSSSEWFGMQPILSWFHIFSNLFPTEATQKIWLRIANFTWFATFQIFSHRSGLEWLRMANFAWFATFLIFSHWSSSEWLGMANFAQLTTFPIFFH